MLKQAIKLILGMIVLLLLIPITTHAGEDLEWQGTIESRPDGLIGTWVIGGESFETDDNTTFENETALTVDSCAEVTYLVEDDMNRALTIHGSEEMDTCDDDDNDSDNEDTHGIVENFPEMLIGEWLIDGESYTTTEETTFSEEHGEFAVGVCVEIEYTEDGDQMIASHISTEEMAECEGDDDDDDGDNDNHGVVESFPETLVGEWIIDNETYLATEETSFEQTHGDFSEGACVEVQASESNGQMLATYIGTQETSACEDGDDGDDGDDDEDDTYGLIESFPEGLIGEWVIEGTTYTTTESTEFEQEDGDFAIGACVEVSYTTTDQGLVAQEIETKEAYHCLGSTGTNEVYGIIDSFPDGLIGEWVVSGSSYMADATTEFEQEDSNFAVGVCVSLKYYTQDGTNHAVEIEAEDDCDNSSPPSDYNKVYATIDSFPATPHIGTWSIGGIGYEATASTEFEQEHGPFEVGTCVEAKYQMTNGTNTLHEVETEQAYKCQEDGSTIFTVYGTVLEMPATGMTGTWNISSISYQADQNTTFDEGYGVLAIGAYVEVKYVMDGNNAIARNIETHVSPNGGLNTHLGTLESYDPSDEWQDWVIDGITYRADPAIDVGTGNQAPEVGQKIFVNSYESSGTRYLTSANRAQSLFLPTVQR